MLKQGGLVNELNVGVGERLRALMAGGLTLTAAAFLLGAIPAWWAAPAVIAVGVANRSLLLLFYRRKGVLFAAAGLLFHQFYYLYSSAAFTWCLMEHQVSRTRRS
jgi:hypothetical protein